MFASGIISVDIIDTFVIVVVTHCVISEVHGGLGTLLRLIRVRGGLYWFFLEKFNRERKERRGGEERRWRERGRVEGVCVCEVGVGRCVGWEVGGGGGVCVLVCVLVVVVVVCVWERGGSGLGWVGWRVWHAENPCV